MGTSSGGGFGASGRVGGIVFRRRKRKTVLAQASGSYGPATDPEQIRTINHLSFVSKLAAAIKKIECFRSMWKSETIPDQNLINTIVRFNYKLVKPDFEINEICFSPMKPEMTIVPLNMELTENSLNIEIEHLEFNVNAYLYTPKVSMIGLIYQKKSNDNTGEYEFEPFVSDDLPINTPSNPIFNIFMKGSIIAYIKKYPIIKVAGCLVQKDLMGTPTKVSNTIYHVLKEMQ